MSDIAHAYPILPGRMCKTFLLCERPKDPAGGARRDRTDDLLLAKQALSQLSYGPIFRNQLSAISNQKQLITDF